MIRLILAFSLSLWIAGAGCMLGCESMAASAANGATSESAHHSSTTALVVSGDACSTSATTKSHDCCKKRSGKVRATTSPSSGPSTVEIVGTSGSSMPTCPLAAGRAVVVAKVNNGESITAHVVANAVFRDLNSSERSAPLSPPLRLPNRGHTYLRCCAFLI